MKGVDGKIRENNKVKKDGDLEFGMKANIRIQSMILRNARGKKSE